MNCTEGRYISSISLNEGNGVQFFSWEKSYSLGTKNRYRYGFNGQEKESDINRVNGGNLLFTYRIHDSRLGRFLSVDPMSRNFPWNSSYAFAENDVIRAIDLEGLEKFIVTEERDFQDGTKLVVVTLIDISPNNGVQVSHDGGITFVQDFWRYKKLQDFYQGIMVKGSYPTENLYLSDGKTILNTNPNSVFSIKPEGHPNNTPTYVHPWRVDNQTLSQSTSLIGQFSNIAFQRNHINQPISQWYTAPNSYTPTVLGKMQYNFHEGEFNVSILNSNGENIYNGVLSGGGILDFNLDHGSQFTINVTPVGDMTVDRGF